MSGRFGTWIKFNTVGILGMGVQLLALALFKSGLGINYLLSYLFFGTMTLEEALRSLRLFSTEVMPKIEKL